MWIDRVEDLISCFNKGQTALVVKNLKTKAVLFSRNADITFPSCSLIKVPILLALLHEADCGRLDINEAVPVNQEDLTGDSFACQLSGALSLSWKDHALFMTALSDNASTNHIISRLGFDAINKSILELGMKNTFLNRKMMDFKARERGIDNYTNCEDMLNLFEHLHDNAGSYEDALHILKQQKMNNLLSGLLDSDSFEFAHKTGALPHTRLDAGIMYLGAPIFIAFMSKELCREKDGQRLAQEIGLLIFEEFAPLA